MILRKIYKPSYRKEVVTINEEIVREFLGDPKAWKEFSSFLKEEITKSLTKRFGEDPQYC